jgi:S1-C subfamily serine protease
LVFFKNFFWTWFFCFLFIPGLFAEKIGSEIQTDAVLRIHCFQESFDFRRPWVSVPIRASMASAFVIEGNQILTNAHVVHNAKYIEIKKPLSAKRYIAHLQYISQVCDLAMLKIDDPSFFEDINPFKVGELPKQNSVVTTLGYPIGGDHLSFTNGVVSRIDNIVYSHSGVDEHLAIQTDAAINPGNSGGPILQDGVVVGMAFQGIEGGDNIGYFIPTTVIKHFLKDASDGTVDGVPELGIYYNALPPSVRSFLKLQKEESGVLIYKVIPHSPADGFLQKNDLLTEINGHSMNDEGLFWLEGLQVPFYEIVERSQWGDSVTLSWIRNGVKHSQPIRLKKYKTSIELGCQYEVNPEYVIFSGLVFVKLSGDYFRTFGKDWWTALPPQYRYLYYFQAFQRDEQKTYLVLSEILYDPSNAHAQNYQNQILETINGIPITNFDSLDQAFSVPKNDFHVLTFLDMPIPLVLSVEESKNTHDRLLQKYKVPKSKRFSAKQGSP